MIQPLKPWEQIDLDLTDHFALEANSCAKNFIVIHSSVILLKGSGRAQW